MVYMPQKLKILILVFIVLLHVNMFLQYIIVQNQFKKKKKVSLGYLLYF